MNRALLIAVSTLGWFVDVSAQEAHVATNAPQDKPLTAEARRYEELLAPYVAMARKSYPEAKARFLKGLPPKESFFVTARLYGERGNFEQVFVVVSEIKEGKIKGRIASDVQRITGYARGAQFECGEREIFDWLITRPDGSEEGNVVGKFLNVVQERRVPLVIEMVVDGRGSVTSAKFRTALNQGKQDVSFCIPDTIKSESERMIKSQRYEPTGVTKTNTAYLIYDFQEKKIEPLKKVQPGAAGAPR